MATSSNFQRGRNPTQDTFTGSNNKTYQKKDDNDKPVVPEPVRSPVRSPSPAGNNFTLYTNHLTPNGLKVSIYLEELKAVDLKLEYTLERIEIKKATQKEPWFLKLNPSGTVPVLIDRNRDDFPIFESAAVLLYLEQNVDRKKHFSFDPQQNPKEYSSMLQWIFFGHGGIGPMQGQGKQVATMPITIKETQTHFTGLSAHFFRHYSPENIPYGKTRYRDETKKLYGVLEIGLIDRDWLVGPERGRFTIADINVLPWIRLYARAGIDNLDEWPNLQAWLSRCLDRAGVKAALKSVHP